MAVHDTAVDAEETVEQLVTELGQAGAPPETLDIIKQVAKVLRQVVKGLGPGPEDAGPEGAAAAAEEAGPPPDETAQPQSIGEATDQMVAEGRR